MEERYKCTEQAVLLTFAEIFLLLESLGIRQVNGIYMAQEPVSDKIAVETLDVLTAKGVVRAQGDVFKLEERTGRILTCMGYPEYDYALEYGEQIYYCYEKGADIAVSFLCRTKEKTLSLSLFDREGFEVWKEEMKSDPC